MPASQPSVLITGANGFVGSRLCSKLLQEGFWVIAGVRRSSDLSSLAALKVEFRYGDVTVPDSLPDMVAGVDYVIHNAGLTKARDVEAFGRVNCQGTGNLLEAIKQIGLQPKRLVYMSSLAAAGPSLAGQPVAEDDPPHPLTAYGRSKLDGEKVVLRERDRFPVVSLRPSGVYGPGDREIFDFFKAVYRGLKPRIGDPERRLQLVHVDDLCHAVYLSLTAEVPSGRTYFVAEHRSYSMRELVDLLQAGCGKRGFTLPLPASLFRGMASATEAITKAMGGTPMLTREKAEELLASWEVSIQRAEAELGYVSRIPFEQGAKETYEWYLRNGWL